MECIRHYQLVPGVIYRNVNGIDYKCISYAGDSATMQRVYNYGREFWRFEAHGICKYPNGIQWDYSTGGRFVEDQDCCYGECDACTWRKRVPGDIDRIDREPQYYCSKFEEV